MLCEVGFPHGDLVEGEAAQTLAVCRAAPESRVVASHLDSLDHGEVSLETLRARAREAGISEAQLLIPAEGEILEL